MNGLNSSSASSGQAALVQLELRANHDDRTAGIVDALAEQILPEAALLALQHVASDFSGRLLAPVMTRPRRPLSNSASTDSCSMRFSCARYVRRAQLHQPLQAVVAVDDAAIKVVEVEVAKRPPSSGTSGRNSRNDRTTVRIIHSGRLRIDERLDDLQPLGQLFRLSVRRGLDDLDADIVAQLLQVHGSSRSRMASAPMPPVKLSSPYSSAPSGTPLRRGALSFSEVRPARRRYSSRNRARAPDLEVMSAAADTARERLQEPNMRDGRRELDMAHSLAPDLGERHFHAAFFADDALYFIRLYCRTDTRNP